MPHSYTAFKYDETMVIHLCEKSLGLLGSLLGLPGPVGLAWFYWACLGLLGLLGSVGLAWVCWACSGLLGLLGSVGLAWV